MLKFNQLFLVSLCFIRDFCNNFISRGEKGFVIAIMLVNLCSCIIMAEISWTLRDALLNSKEESKVCFLTIPQAFFTNVLYF